jgi:glycosyltransferase involved in cell wall biosynthesis
MVGNGQYTGVPEIDHGPAAWLLDKRLSMTSGAAVEGRERPGGPLRVLEFRSAEGAGGGPEKTILLGAARTDPRRFSVTLCYIRDARDPSVEIDASARQLGLDYVEIRQRRVFDPAVWRAARRLVRERQIDIVHAHDYKTDLLALILARKEGVIPLSTAHGWTGHSRRERLFYYPVDKRLLARFPCVIAVSSQIRQDLLHAGARPGRVRTVLNGINHRAYRRKQEQRAEVRAKLGVSAGEIVLGAMGRLEPQKAFDLLLETFALLSSNRPALRLLIAGEGSAREELAAKATHLGLDAGCRFLGHYANAVEFHHALDLFVQASDYEGTPNVILEAMALETPVVATEVGGTGEVIEDGVHGLLVPPRDTRALAAAIERTLADPEATRRRVRAARARVERELSFDARMRTVEAIYEGLGAAFPRRRFRRKSTW